MTTQHDAIEMVKAALECSVYVSPREHGLTAEELQEVCRRVGFRQGEVMDAVRAVQPDRQRGNPRLMIPSHEIESDFFTLRDPEPRNPDAFDFVRGHLRDLAKDVGRDRSAVTRESLVAGGVAAGVLEVDIEVAITVGLLCGHLGLEKGLVRLSGGTEAYPLASEQLANANYESTRPLGAVLAHVRDVVGRRSDGRSLSPEPTRAFEAALADLEYGHFRQWWRQTLDELERASPGTGSLTMCVLSAALVEGALIFIVRRAQALQVPTLASKTFTTEPYSRWRFEDLLTSAAAGGPAAVFDPGTRDRVERLARLRQRIHAGRLVHDNPTGPIPDLQPDAAREARETLDIALRRILEWLARHPASAASASSSSSPSAK